MQVSLFTKSNNGIFNAHYTNERIFQAHIGISPKQYLKIVRFQNAIFIKQNSKAITLTDLAYEAGYYDQSHFIKEIKDLAGKTPKKLFESEEIISHLFY